MTKTIYKESLALEDRQALRLQRGAKMLSVAEQYSGIYIWYLCDSQQPRDEEVKFYVVGTGNPMPDLAGEFLGTVKLAEGRLMFHVFYRRVL